MIHVTYLKASRHASSRHTHERVIIHRWKRHSTLLEGLSHIRMSYVTRMNASCRTHGCVEPHIQTSHITHINESCYTYECIMSHMWTSHAAHVKEAIHPARQHVTYTNESCHTWEWVVVYHLRVQNTHTNTSCHPYEHIYVRHSRIRVCNMTHSWVWRDKERVRDFERVTLLTCATRIHVFTNKVCHPYKCLITRTMSHVRKSHVTHMRKSHVPHICVTRVKEWCDTRERVIARIWRRHATQTSVTFQAVTPAWNIKDT